jgi:sec-independent protein translocase protein TatA
VNFYPSSAAADVLPLIIGSLLIRRLGLRIGKEVHFMNTSLAVLGLSGGELIIVLVAILILFGAKRIPEFAKGLGQGIKEFKKASSDVTNEFHNAMNQEPPPPPPPAKPLPAPETAAPSSTVPKS